MVDVNYAGMSETEYEALIVEKEAEIAARIPESRSVELLAVPLGGDVFDLPQDFQYLGVGDNKVVFIRAQRTAGELRKAAEQEVLYAVAGQMAQGNGVTGTMTIPGGTDESFEAESAE